MIWFRIKALEKLLIEGKVSDKLAFYYLLTHLIFLTVAGYISDDYGPRWVLLLHFMISLMAVIWGVRKTYKINEEGDNQDYLKRFLSLSFVAGIRMLLLIIIISVPLAVARMLADTYHIHLFNSTQEHLLLLFAYLFYNVLYYHILLRSFKRINAADGRIGQPVEVV
ncbi:hypothetical protein [Salinimicrobium sp. GXAS 041]|uniref:hypothetical protein n=1 Tax=Salinimicrobium sp. GXAS 041 TaxID=3400806 RepID=UPI003C7951BB